MGLALAAAPQAQAEPPAAGILVIPGDESATGAAAALSERANAQGQVRVIVGLSEEMADEQTLAPAAVKGQRARLRSAQQAVLAHLGNAVKTGEKRTSTPEATASGVDGVTLFDTIPFLALNTDAASLQVLLSAPGVASVQEDVPVPPTLLQSVPLIKADQAAALGFSGTGQVVAVLDTGVYKTHPMLTGKVVSEACYSSTVAGQSTSQCPGGAASSTAVGSGVNCPTSIAGCDHGTHVASIAVGNASNIKGVASGARLIAIQVFSRFTTSTYCGSQTPCILSYTSDFTKGLERVYALRNTYSIASANLSLGGGSYPTKCDAQVPATTAIIKKLRNAKIATAIASGNNGYNGFVSSPGCISAAVTVGSTTKSDTLSWFSNHAKLVDLLAPGESILAAVPGGGLAIKSGTSMATPHVAGAFAILKQAKPTATITELQNALSCTGKPIAPRGGVSKRRIDVLAALNVVRSPATGCN
ncbi:MAG: S8 family serine peptidase [Rhodospirillales bacterium]